MSEKRLYKSNNRMLCGVCGGIAEYFNVDPTIIRLIAVVLAFASIGTGIVAYIIAAVIMPDQPKNTSSNTEEDDIPKKSANID